VIKQTQKTERMADGMSRNAGIVALLFSLLLPQPGQAQTGKSKLAAGSDGRPVMEQTLHAYQQLNSYHGRSLVDLNLLEPGGVRQQVSGESTSLWFRRPNKLAIKLTSNKTTIEVYCDGKTLSVYLLDSQKYFSVPAPTDMPGIAKVLHDKAGIDALMDPLFFLSIAKLPDSLKKVYVNNDNVKVNDRAGTELLCELRTLDTLKKGNFFLQDKAKWLVSVDKQNSLLLQTQVSMPGTAVVRAYKYDPKAQKNVPMAVPMKVSFEMRHLVVQATPNEAFSDSVFAFTPPKGATRQQDVLELLGNRQVNTDKPSNQTNQTNTKDGKSGNNGIKF